MSSESFVEIPAGKQQKQQNQQKQQKIRDLIFILALILVGAAIAAIVLLRNGTGDHVTVRMGDGTVREYPLDQDKEIKLELADGRYNLLVIRDGSAWVEEASCPDGLCIHMGRISRQGQSIICLPNKLIIEVDHDHNTANSSDAIDAIVR